MTSEPENSESTAEFTSTRLTFLPRDKTTDWWLSSHQYGFLPFHPVWNIFSSPCSCRLSFLDMYPQFLKERTEYLIDKLTAPYANFWMGPELLGSATWTSSAWWHRSYQSLIDDSWTTRICEDRLFFRWCSLSMGFKGMAWLSLTWVNDLGQDDFTQSGPDNRTA